MKLVLLCLICFINIWISTAQLRESHFITMPDGVKLAADVYFPETYAGAKLPTLVQFERYWRSSISRNGKDTSTIIGRDKYFSDNGYIIVIVDTRGTGASFGTRESEYSPQQVKDSKFVLDWIVAQSWSDGIIGAYGTSYTGTEDSLKAAIKEHRNNPKVHKYTRESDFIVLPVVK